MSLLSEAEKREIRDAIQSVTDTFMVTPVYYHMLVGSLDVWNEDRQDAKYNTYILAGLVEYGTTDDTETRFKSESTSVEDGVKDYEDVTITFNLEDLERKGLITPEYTFKFQKEVDYFTTKGILYKVLDAYYDGPLDSKNVLVILKGRITQERPNIGENIVQ